MEKIGIVFAAAIALLLVVQLFRSPEGLFIAFRNVRHGSRRTVMAVAAIATSVVGLTLFGGFVTDSFHRLREGTIGSGIGHVQIFRAGYTEDNGRHPAQFSLREDEFHRIEALIAKDPWLSSHVSAISPELEFFGVAVSADSQGDFMCRAVIPERDALVAIPRIIAGEPLQTPDEPTVSLAGLLAKKLGAQPGQTVRLQTFDRLKGYRAMEPKVKGHFTSSFAEWDRYFLKVPLATAWRMFEDTPLTRIVVRLNKTSDTAEFNKRLLSVMKADSLDVETRTWSDLAVYYNQVHNMLSGVYRFVLIVIMVIVLVLVANVVSMTVLERTPEVGTLRAIGTRRQKILLLFLNEGVMIGLLGGMVGVLVAVIVSSLLNIKGIPQPPPPGSTLPIVARIRFNEGPGVLLTAFLGPLISATLASIWPSVRAAKMNIAEALRRGL